MSKPKIPPKAHLFCSLFSGDVLFIEDAMDKLERKFGPIAWCTNYFPFDTTDYYTKEFGDDLKRILVGFYDLVDQGDLVEIKLITYEIENELSREGNRLVNIDPGLLTAERVILATGKNYTHRIYLGKGIYADLTLIYYNKSYKALSWTYPDYASKLFIDLFNDVRKTYLKRLRFNRNN